MILLHIIAFDSIYFDAIKCIFFDNMLNISKNILVFNILLKINLAHWIQITSFLARESFDSPAMASWAGQIDALNFLKCNIIALKSNIIANNPSFNFKNGYINNILRILFIYCYKIL